MKCNNCGATFAEDSAFCPFCAAPVNTAECGSSDLPPVTAATSPSKKKKSHLILWILGAVIILLITVVIAGLCTNWFGFYGPATQIVSAVDNTLKSGSFTVDLRMNLELGSGYFSFTQQLDGTIEVELNTDDRTLMMYGQLELEDKAVMLAIYNQHFIVGTADNLQKQDISEPLNTFFDNYEATEELDWEELLNRMDEDLYEEIREVIDFEELENCLIAYGKNLNNTGWLEEYAGYFSEKENGELLHQFKPKTSKFLSASLECFEPAFKDGEDYENLMNTIHDGKSTLNSVDLDATFGIRGNQLTSFELKAQKESNVIRLALGFTKLGDTPIDENNLKTLLDQAS